MTMTADGPDQTSLAIRLETIIDRLDTLEVQVRGLVTSQAVEASAFVVRDDRGHVRAQSRCSSTRPVSRSTIQPARSA